MLRICSVCPFSSSLRISYVLKEVLQEPKKPVNISREWGKKKSNFSRWQQTIKITFISFVPFLSSIWYGKFYSDAISITKCTSRFRHLCLEILSSYHHHLITNSAGHVRCLVFCLRFLRCKCVRSNNCYKFFRCFFF